MSMGKPFASSQLELARNNQRNTCVNTMGQSSGPTRTYSSGGETNHALFSKSHGSAWDNALRVAEELLQGTQKAPPGPGPPAPAGVGARRSTSSPSGLDHGRAYYHERTLAEEERTEVSLDDLIVELEAAEEDSKTSPAQWQGVVERIQMDDPGGHAQRLDSSTSSSGDSGNVNGYELRTASTGVRGRDRRSSDSESQFGSSGVSEEVISERAAQWGYGVVLKNSRNSTPRTSNGSTGGPGGQAIPGVSSTIKDALTSFQLAFLVCDATHDDFPILYASAGFTTMTGYSADETVGKNCRFLQGADTDRSEIARLREALKNGATYTGTILNYKKDGTPFWNLLTISPIKDNAGNVIKYIGMQAEQTSKDQQRRKSGGQRSAEARPLQPLPSGIALELLDETHGNNVKLGGTSAGAGASAPPTRRHSSGSNSLLKPPVDPQRSLPGERHSAGPELHIGEAPKRLSQRYSLSSNPARSSRTSSVVKEGSSQSDWRDAALKLRVGMEGGKKSSFFETPNSSSTSSTAELPTQKSRSGRLTSRILRLFRKPFKESKRPSETVSSGSAKHVSDFSDSDEEERDEVNSSDFSARNSRTRPHSSGVFSSSGESGPRSFKRPDAATSAYDLRNKLKEHLSENSRNESPRAPQFDITKQQFCIVHS